MDVKSVKVLRCKGAATNGPGNFFYTLTHIHTYTHTHIHTYTHLHISYIPTSLILTSPLGMGSRWKMAILRGISTGSISAKSPCERG